MFAQLKNMLLSFLIAFVVAFIFGFFVARGQYAPPKVTAETLLVSMQNEGFFVTQELILEETVIIDSRSGNALKDFFVSETVEAEADLRIALGVDTNTLTSEDIRVEGKQIMITLPAPTVFSTEVVGDVDIDSDRGIITRITAGEEDYNGLVATLKEQARASVADEDIANAIKLGSIDSIERFLGMIAPQYTAVISFE